MDADTLFAVELFGGIVVTAFNLWLVWRVVTFMDRAEKHLEAIRKKLGD